MSYVDDINGVSLLDTATWPVAPADAVTPQAYPSGWSEPGEMHFMLRDRNLGDLHLTCETGYIVRQYDFGYPDVREVSYVNALSDGMYDFSKWLGSRAVTLDMALRPTASIDGTGDQWSEPQMRDRLLAYVQPMRRPSLIFTEQGDRRVKQITLRAADASYAVSLPRFNLMNVSWVAPNPIFRGYTQKCATAQLNEISETIHLKVVNEGNASADWTLTLDGQIKNPRISLDGLAAYTLQLGYTAKVTDVVVFDSYTKSVTINGKATGYRYISDNSHWFRIPPGTHDIVVFHDDSPRQGWPYGRWQPFTDPTNWAAPPYAPFDPDNPTQTPPPPPWAWSTDVDPGTGEPGVTDISLCFWDSWS